MRVRARAHTHTHTLTAPECVDLMQKMLAYDAAERMSAREGLQHAYFRDVRELEARSVVCARVVCGLWSVGLRSVCLL